MLRSTLLVLSLSIQLSLFATAEESRLISDAENVIAIYTNDWGLRASGGTKLVVGIWGDGTAIWSDDPVEGGAPFFTARLNPQDVLEVLKRFAERGAFDIPRLRQANFGPDSHYTTLLVRTAGKELKMDSWHELFEANGKVVVGAGGVTGLQGRKLYQALAEQPADYLHYRMTWLELRLSVADLLPKSGTATSGAAAMLHGKLSWSSGESGKQ